MTDIDLSKDVASASTDYSLYTSNEMTKLSSVVLDAGSATGAYTTSSNTQNFTLTPGLTLVVSIDGGGNQTATWDAAAGTMTDTTSYPVADQDGKNCTITVDGGGAQTVTFSGATTTATSVASQIDAQITGATATESGGQVVVTSDSFGTGSTVAFGAGTSGLTFGAPTAGTGDVVDISAVTGAEIKTVFDADITGGVATVLADGYVQFATSATGATHTIKFDATGTANTAIGVDTDTHTGSDGYSPARGDILCYDTGDSNKHVRYNANSTTHVIMGIVDEVTTDSTTPTANQVIVYAYRASVHYGAAGKDNILDAARKLALVNAARAKNITLRT